MLPNAVMVALNELALDLTGEIALEDLGDEILISAVVLVEVLSKWDGGLICVGDQYRQNHSALLELWNIKRQTHDAAHYSLSELA